MILVEKQRFPRTDDRDLLYMIKVKAKYPPPDYNPHTDGSWSPANWIIDSGLKHTKKEMRKLCIKHALDPTGPKRKLMKRMYLHWRAKKLLIGTDYFGYGKGYENTRMPDCPCGSLKVSEWESIQKKKEDIKEIRRRQKLNNKIRRFPREPIYRYPRLPKGEVWRFPR